MVNSSPHRPRIGILAGTHFYSNMFSVLRRFKKIVDTECRLDILTAVPKVPRYIYENYNIYHGKKKFFLDEGSFHTNFSLLNQYIDEYEPDVLGNICHPYSEGVMTAFVGKLRGVPTFVRMTGDTYLEASPRPWGLESFKAWFDRSFLADLSYRLSDRIIALGSILQERLIEVGHSPTKIAVIPQPFDQNRFSPVTEDKKKSIRREFGLPINKKIILFVGRISKLKGADRLLEIVEEVLAEREDFYFCLVGEGVMASDFQRFSEEFIGLPGRVSYEDIPGYYRAADCFLLPSRLEGLPNVILEALAAELPVMATAVGEIPTLVDNLSSDPGDYVQFLLGGEWEPTRLPDLYRRENLKEVYVRFLWDILHET